MDKKALVINFVISFVAAYLAIALYMQINNPRMFMKGHMMPPPQYMEHNRPMYRNYNMPQQGRTPGQMPSYSPPAQNTMPENQSVPQVPNSGSGFNGQR